MREPAGHFSFRHAAMPPFAGDLQVGAWANIALH